MPHRGQLRSPRPDRHGCAAKLRKVVEEKGIPADIEVYPHVGHSFANKLPGQAFLRITGFGYDDAATEDAYARVFAFFDKHLRRETGSA